MQYVTLVLLMLWLSSVAESSSRTSWLSRFLRRERGSTTATTTTTNDGFTILEETLMYSGWRTIVKRKVRMRNGKVVDFDVSVYEVYWSRVVTFFRSLPDPLVPLSHEQLVGVKTGGSAVMVFAWNTHTKTATLVREYMPASHRILYGLAAGLVEEKHGADVATAARDELEEEAHLTGGQWIHLCKRPSAMDKYSLTSVEAYLVLDPVPEENPKPLDDEEDIEILAGVTIPEIKEWISNGEMNLVSAWGCMLAIEKLRELGEYP
jgi:NUDIX domain